MLFFPDCSTVIQGAPRLVASTPMLVVGVPMLVVGAHMLVVGTPKLVAGAPSCSQVHPTFSPMLRDVPKLITITPIILLYQSSENPITVRGSPLAVVMIHV